MLVIAYHFPPDNAIGARRTAKFVKYLPEFGWSSRVLTVRERYYDMVNAEECRFPEASCTITRTRMIEEPPGAYKAVRKLIKPRHQGTVNAAWDPNPGDAPFWMRLVFSLQSMPDDKHGWFPFAFGTGLRVIRESPVSCIYSSGPPWTGHLIALALQRASGLPWVADFRDPWSTHRYKPASSTTWLSERVEEILRTAVFRSADALVVNTQQAADRLLVARPWLSDKTFAILNGFDPDEAVSASHTRGNGTGPRVLVHAGSLFPQRDPFAFLSAIESLAESGRLAPGQMQVVFYGPNDLTNRATFALMNRLAREGWVVQQPPAPRGESTKLIARADGLLLLDGGRPVQIPAKLYDYLQAGRPILAITEPNSPAAQIVERTQTGIVANCTNRECIEAGILRVLDTVDNGAFTPNKARVAEYDVTQLTGRLAEVLDMAAGRRMHK